MHTDTASGARCFQTMVPMRDGIRLNTFVFLQGQSVFQGNPDKVQGSLRLGCETAAGRRYIG